MKTISLLQPWASLVAIGAKRVETRSWRTQYRGPLAIHASAGFPEDCKGLTYHEPFNRVLRGHFGLTGSPSVLPLGAVLCVVRLVECFEITNSSVYRFRGATTGRADRTRTVEITPQEKAFGDFTPGRYGWALEWLSTYPEPIRAKGSLGLWDWTPPEPVDAVLPGVGLFAPRPLGGLFGEEGSAS